LTRLALPPSNTTGAIAELFAYELDGDSFSLGAGASQAYSLSTSDVQAGVLTALQTATDFSLGYTLFASGGATTSGTSVENIFSATSNLKVEVTYSYEVAAIPVPAALPLLATAFGALGLLRLRRKA
jgi:hypothetical protein